MSRVERRETDQRRDAREEERNFEPRPSKAEGEEGVVDEALRNQDDEETLRIPRG